jgi:HK97 family phage prohead protease
MKKRLRKKLLNRSMATADPKERAEDQMIRRTITLSADDMKEDRIEVSISSETDKIRSFWSGNPQILLHEKGAVDFKPLREVGAILFNHDPDQIVGRPENVRLDEEERKIRASIVFDKDLESQRIAEKVRSGSLRGASVGFRVESWRQLDDGDEWTSPGGRNFKGPMDVATKWRILEFSLTPIPADAAVGVNRTATGREPKEVKEFRMDPKLREALVKRGLDPNATDEEAQAFMLRMATEDPKPAPKPNGDEPTNPPPPPTESSVRLAHAAETRERERATEMAEMIGQWPQYRDQIVVMIRENYTVEQARGEILEQLKRDRPQTPVVSSGIEYGEDARPKFRRAAADSLLLRCNRLRQEKGELPSAWESRHQQARDVCGYSLFDLMRTTLRSCGLSDRGTREDLMSRAFSHSTSDFPAILKDAANKRLLAAYQEAPSTWRPLVRIGNAADFKPLNRPKFGDMGNLVLTPDLVPMAEGSTVDVNESFSIGTYTKRFGIGRQAIINDDLSAFDRIPTGMGNQAARTVTDTFYNLLISASGVGPTMAEDSVALFATTHTSGSNYIASTGTPEVTGLGALMKLMRLQKGLVTTGETAPILNVQPRFLLVPAALEILAAQTVGSIADPAKSNDITRNPFTNMLTLIVEPRLDAATNGSTAWYLVASPDVTEGAEVAFLNGNEMPTMMTIQGDNVLGTQWAVFLDFGVKFIEHRGWARTKGA